MEPPAATPGPLTPFAALVFATVVWIISVVVLFPRLLGHLVAFLANRTSRTAFHLSLPTLHIYLLSGRAVAHSARLTLPSGTVAVEEVVLQVRWWRRPQPRTDPADDHHHDALALDHVAVQQQRIDKENAAPFAKRVWYRLRRWWRRATGVDIHDAHQEPSSLISLVCVGVRARIVNDERSHTHIKRIIAAEKASVRRSSLGDDSLQASHGPRMPPHVSLPLDEPSDDASDDSYSSVQSADEKPVLQRLLELVSLRINDGAFYICDMGQSPLMRVTVDMLKLRYRYGAPASPVDLCRKRVIFTASGMRLSVASRAAVDAFLEAGPVPPMPGAATSSRDPDSPGRMSASLTENTDSMIRRVVEEGHRGISEPSRMTPSVNHGSMQRDRSQRRQRHTPARSMPSVHSRSAHETRPAKRKRSLHCVDILDATTAVIVYVFDEPGASAGTGAQVVRNASASATKHRANEFSQDDSSPFPPPVCRLSILLHGAEGCYDVGAVADIERVVERLQPFLYDLTPFAKKLQQREGKRAAVALTVDVEATPKEPKQKQDTDMDVAPLLTVPFNARESTWIGLLAANVRQWGSQATDVGNLSKTQSSATPTQLPQSHLAIQSSRLTVKTEVPFQIGAEQKAIISLKDVHVDCKGVVNLPMLKASSVTVCRIVHVPNKWYEEHQVSTDILASSFEFVYVSDTTRIIDDISATVLDNIKKPLSVSHAVPFKEITKIRAEDKFCVVLSCCADNAWEDLENGVPDEYGKLKICGDNGELVLSPNVATEFFPDQAVLSWSLSIPNAVGKMELPVVRTGAEDNRARESATPGRHSDTSYSSHAKTWQASRTKRARSQLESLSGPGLGSRDSSKRNTSDSVTIDIVKFGRTCKLSGKVVAHMKRKYLDTDLPAFLDAVNYDDLNFIASAVTLDLNPFHLSPFLNLARNYAGHGACTLSVAERAVLDASRTRHAKSILAEGRMPTAHECLLLCFAPGYTLPSQHNVRTGMDDVVRISLQINSLMVRLHDLPHRAAPFNPDSQNVCTAECDRLLGSISTNRLGLHLSFNPNPKRNVVSLYSGYLSSKRDSSRSGSVQSTTKVPPMIAVQNLSITKRALGSEFWGPYCSALHVTVGKVSGSLLDTAVICLSNFSLSAIPDPLCEEVLAVGALIAVDNVEVVVEKVDAFVLSTSSSSQLGVVRHSSNYVSKRKSEHNWQTGNRGIPIPTFLSGVTHTTLPKGLRVVMSSLSWDLHGFLTRVVLPAISTTLYVSSGGTLISWVDDATVRAQVSHATVLRKGAMHETLAETGVLKKAMELPDLNFELFSTWKPELWSGTMPSRQRNHVSEQGSLSRDQVIPWSLQEHRSLKRASSGTSLVSELKLSWWEFLRFGKVASLLWTQNFMKACVNGKVDAMSFVIDASQSLIICPEALQVIADVVLRSKETVKEKFLENFEENNSLPDIPRKLLTVELLTLWRHLESRKANGRSFSGKSTLATFVKAVEVTGGGITFQSLPLRGEDGRDGLYSSNDLKDSVVLTADEGIHFMHTVNTSPSSRSLSNRVNSSNGLRTESRQLSISRACINCSDIQVANLKDLLVITRCRIKSEPYPNSMGGKDLSNRRERNTFIGRISSVDVGGKYGQLKEYGSLGRVASIYLLLFRVLYIRSVDLTEARNVRLTRFCLSILSAPLERVFSKDIDEARSFFATYTRLANEKISGSKTIENRSLSRRAPPRITNLTDADLTSSQSVVNSVDAILTNARLRVSDEEIFHLDKLVCKGGSTFSRSMAASESEGLILNASVGTVSFSIRDDIAADTLKMVSNIASFARRATFSLPILRQEGPVPERPGRNSSELLAFNYNNETLTKRVGYLNSPASVGRSRNVSRINSIGRNSLPSPSVQKRRHQWSILRDGKMSSGAAREASSDPKTTEPQFASHLTPSELERYGGEGDLSPQGEKAVPMKPQISREELLDTELEPVGNSERSYLLLGLRTAGESGPPRKRSKVMVRVAQQGPPAFANQGNTSRSALTDDAVGHSGDNDPGMKSPASPGPEPVGYRDAWRSSATQAGAHVDFSPKTTPHIDREARSTETRPSPRSSRPKVTLFVSCGDVISRYFRCREAMISQRESIRTGKERVADITFHIMAPRLTFMSSPLKHSYSAVLTASSAKVTSGQDPHCTLSGSIAGFGVKLSMAKGHQTSTLPKLIISSRVTEFKSALHARDLQSVLRFREEFKLDMKAVLVAFLSTKDSISEMARATRLSSSRVLHSGRTIFSTMAFDTLFEDSQLRLQGFHPKDHNMSITYELGSLFFSVVASDDDSAALTLGLRVYEHGLRLSSPSWPDSEFIRFPSLDTRGVQWGEATGLPTILKLTAEPLVNSTSFQGLRHVLFTVAGLLAFQNVSQDTGTNAGNPNSAMQQLATTEKRTSVPEQSAERGSHSTTPFSRSFAAWERTKGVRMDVSIRPMSLSLASGQVVAAFDVETITGIFEWNKLVVSGVQLHAAVSLPRVSLSFMRLPTTSISNNRVRPDETRTSLSVVLEKSRLDILKSQKDLTHTFIFRVDVYAVSGQLRPWKLLLDAAVWADEQEFVSDLQSINYSAHSTSRQRQSKTQVSKEVLRSLQHRVILCGANIQRVILAVPLLNSEPHVSSRLALRATELHVLARQRFDRLSTPVRNTIEIKSHFIGILWESSSLLSSHHARITLGITPSLRENLSHFGSLTVVLVPGTWRICPRKDVVMAILDAKNRKDNKKVSEKTPDRDGRRTEAHSVAESSNAEESLSNATDMQSRLLVDSLNFKILRTSGFIEGLDGDENPPFSEAISDPKVPEASNKLSVPAFSICAVRNARHEFDLIDVDFSGREGEFPRGCLQKVVNLFSDLFGAVASDQKRSEGGESLTQIQPREMSRSASVLVRFGKSRYRAQEEVNATMEARFGVFAGRSSAILVSLTTEPICNHEECSHTTVISGASPMLRLEITPQLEGSEVQSLRLVDARILHGLCPCLPAHSLLHVPRVVALTEAKTLLLVENRLRPKGAFPEVHRGPPIPTKVTDAERRLVLMFGNPRVRRKSADAFPETNGRETRMEPNVRLQLKLTAKGETAENRVDLGVDRVHLGLSSGRQHPHLGGYYLVSHGAFHELVLRAKWEDLFSKLRLREDLFCFELQKQPGQSKNAASVSNILNRVHVEVCRFDIPTLKLGVDALALSCTAPDGSILVHSTEIQAEVSHTLSKAVSKLFAQWKKLRNEVKLGSEREISRRDMPSSSVSPRSTSFERRRVDPAFLQRNARNVRGDVAETGSFGSISSGVSIPFVHKRTHVTPGGKTTVDIFGNQVLLILRGYQFDESRHSAHISLSNYRVDHVYNFDEARSEFRTLSTQFDEMKMSYNDEEREVVSDLFTMPHSDVRLLISDEMDGMQVRLGGDLKINLGHGIYYVQKFKELLELTIRGPNPAAAREGNDSDNAGRTPSIGSDPWGGREPEVIVELNPHIDVIGDLTRDVMQFMEGRIGNKMKVIPQLMYEHVVIPIELMSKILCDPLSR